MKKITCIAIDDEPLALGLIAGYITKTPFLELQGQFDNVIDAMEYMENDPVQLLFLDIQMPDLTGVDFARMLGNKCKVIFTTAYDQYAVEGFELDALDYLLKPVSYEVFLRAAERAKEYFGLLDSARSGAGTRTKSDYEYLFVKSGARIKRINYNDILYFEGLKDYVQIYMTKSEKPVIFLSTMKSLEEKLPLEKFMRVHRSYIVNLDKVKTIERYRIIFNKKYIPVSEKYKERFDEFVRKKFL